MARLYSVWALAPPDHPGLQSTALMLRKSYGGPEFEAHVTVLGGVTLSLDEATMRLQRLARSLPPITYKIQGVDHGATYFQSVFLTIDPSPQVVEANKQGAIAFEVAGSEHSVYFPHMSLLYGDLKEEDKKSAKATAEEDLRGVLKSEFVVSTLSLWETDTEDKLLTTWKKVAEFPLEGSS